MDEEKAVTLLVIGTENKDLIILDQTGLSIKKQLQLKSVPCFIECSGQFDVEYRIFIACRDGKIYQVRNGAVAEQVFNVDSKPVGFVRFEKQLVIAAMN